MQHKFSPSEASARIITLLESVLAEMRAIRDLLDEIVDRETADDHDDDEENSTEDAEKEVVPR